MLRNLMLSCVARHALASGGSSRWRLRFRQSSFHHARLAQHPTAALRRPAWVVSRFAMFPFPFGVSADSSSAPVSRVGRSSASKLRPFEHCFLLRATTAHPIRVTIPHATSSGATGRGAVNPARHARPRKGGLRVVPPLRGRRGFDRAAFCGTPAVSGRKASRHINPRLRRSEL
jgi:hypothetical protein